MVRAALAACLTLLLAGEAWAQTARQMEFQLTGQRSGALAVRLEYLDPSSVDPLLGGSRALPVAVTVRNTSTEPVALDYEAVRLGLGGDTTLRPLAAAAVADEIRKMKRTPGLLRFIGRQSSAYHPGALESALAGKQLSSGRLAPGAERKGLVYFLRPPDFSDAGFNGVLLFEVGGLQPQMLATSKVGVETKAPDRPSFTARLWELWTTYLSPTPPAFNKSYALVVGIGKYRHMAPLASPAQDVLKMKEYLEAQGFDEVVTLVDDQVTLEAFRYPQRYLQGKMQVNDRFLFYYSGHGITDGTGTATRGFIPLAVEVDDGRHRDSIAMLDLVRWLKGLSVEHLMVVLDSCFSGLAVDGVEMKSNTIRQPDPKIDAEALNRMARGPARYMLMAGTAGQQSFGGTRWNGSLFTQELLTGLRREADLYKDRIVTARELYVWLRPAVEREAQRANRELSPMFVDLGPGGASRGEFVFVQ